MLCFQWAFLGEYFLSIPLSFEMEIQGFSEGFELVLKVLLPM